MYCTSQQKSLKFVQMKIPVTAVMYNVAEACVKVRRGQIHVNLYCDLEIIELSFHKEIMTVSLSYSLVCLQDEWRFSGSH
jgi:tRNA/tmRNA/rRNA uracil-C5-methylase (TrmA/RlmC/RlmD family)